MIMFLVKNDASNREWHVLVAEVREGVEVNSRAKFFIPPTEEEGE